MINFVEETGSTNADLVRALNAGTMPIEGDWLVAEQQNAGRGRSGREWISKPGNLYASTVVQLQSSDPPPQTLALAIGLGVHEQVVGSIAQASHRHVALKWPNDVLVRGAKVAGILLERTGQTIVVGIGINIAFAPEIPGRITACICNLNGKYEADPGFALTTLAPRIAEELIKWRSMPPSVLIDRWLLAAHPIGSQLSVHVGDNENISGSFAGLNEEGALMLRLANGAIRTIHAGDVSLIADKGL